MVDTIVPAAASVAASPAQLRLQGMLWEAIRRLRWMRCLQIHDLWIQSGSEPGPGMLCWVLCWDCDYSEGWSAENAPDYDDWKSFHWASMAPSVRKFRLKEPGNKRARDA